MEVIANIDWLTVAGTLTLTGIITLFFGIATASTGMRGYILSLWSKEKSIKWFNGGVVIAYVGSGILLTGLLSFIINHFI